MMNLQNQKPQCFDDSPQSMSIEEGLSKGPWFSEAANVDQEPAA